MSVMAHLKVLEELDDDAADERTLEFMKFNFDLLQKIKTIK